MTLKEKNLSLWRYSPNEYSITRTELLILSFLKNFDLDDLSAFFIICPKDEIQIFRNLFAKYTSDPRFIFVSEDSLIAPFFSFKTLKENKEGWYIQQIIKLAAATIVKTDFYITLDSDILCTKYFNYQSVVNSNRAFTNIETPEIYNRIYTQKFSYLEQNIKKFRIRETSQLMRVKRDVNFKDIFYGETPVAYHVETIVNLLEYLSSLYGNWVAILFKTQGWTEVYLYFLYLEYKNEIKLHHIFTNHKYMLDLERSIWQTNEKYLKPRSYSPYLLTHAGPEDGIFVAIQSYLNKDKWLQATTYSSIETFYALLKDEII